MTSGAIYTVDPSALTVYVVYVWNLTVALYVVVGPTVDASTLAAFVGLAKPTTTVQ